MAAVILSIGKCWFAAVVASVENVISSEPVRRNVWALSKKAPERQVSNDVGRVVITTEPMSQARPRYLLSSTEITTCPFADLAMHQLSRRQVKASIAFATAADITCLSV